MRFKIITTLAIAATVLFSASAKDTSPTFPDGDKALKQYFIDNIQYQQSANGKKKFILMLKIDAEGNVIQALPQIEDNRLRAAVVDAAMSLPQFVPGTVKGKAAAAWMKVEVPLDAKKAEPEPNSVTDFAQRTEIIIVNDEDFGRQPVVKAPVAEAKPANTKKQQPKVEAPDTKTVSIGKIYRASEVTSGPEFPGGERALTQYIEENIQYPATTGNLTGTVLIKVVITADGSVAEPSVVRGMAPDFNAEALKVVKSLPKFSPAQLKGKPVNCQRIITVYFSPK